MKKTNVVTSNGHSQYILTLTLYEHLCSFKRVGLQIPERVEIDNIENGLTRRVKEVFEGSKSVVEIIKFGDFCDEIVSTAKDLKIRMPDAVVVSTTPMIVYDTGGICIGLSRLIDVNGNIISIGSRAGTCSVEKQIELISRELRGRRVIILEDGSFTGSTLCYMLEKLSSCEANVVAIVMGLLFPVAKKKLTDTFKGELVCKYHFENPFDWMPSHDFFPFVPNSGRVIGTKVGDSLMPLHMFDRSTLSKPYVLPYGQLDDWAGLPLTKNGMVEFSRFCIEGSMQIFRTMEKLNGKTITVGDVIDTRPTTSVPLPFGRTRLDSHDLGMRVVDVLREDCRWLNESN